MKAAGMSAFREVLLDKPSVLTANRCAICGKWATNAHHVIQKGMGGVSPETERRIPKVTLCGSGTTGCHGDVHAHLLHLYWSDGLGGWVYHRTAQPVNDYLDWYQNSSEYRPMPGWTEQKLWGDVIGARK